MQNLIKIQKGRQCWTVYLPGNLCMAEPLETQCYVVPVQIFADSFQLIL